MIKNIVKQSGFRFCVLIFGISILNLVGCTTTPVLVRTPLQQGLPGIYHKVERGQTLWRISKLYNSDIDDIASVNHISDTSSIEAGQLIFIPNQKKEVFAPAGASSDDFIWPVRGRIISGFRQVYNNMINNGINIQPYSNTDVAASQAGKVVFYSDDFGPFGKTIIIQHGEGLSTVYARNSQVFIKAGDTVQRGTIIAKVGAAGRDKNRYLHFEVRKGHVSKNPSFYLP